MNLATQRIEIILTNFGNDLQCASLDVANGAASTRVDPRIKTRCQFASATECVERKSDWQQTNARVVSKFFALWLKLLAMAETTFYSLRSSPAVLKPISNPVSAESEISPEISK